MIDDKFPESGEDYSLNVDEINCNTISNYQWNIYGYLFLLSSSFAGGFGNGLESVSILSFLHSFLLISGLQVLHITNEVASKFRFSIIIVSIILTQACGFCLGFSGVFALPERTILTNLQSFIAGVIMWSIFSVIAVIPHLLFIHKYPESLLISFIYPVSHTFVADVLIGSMLSTFPINGNAVLDYTPLKQLASIFGIGGIHFVTILFGSFPALLLFERTKSVRTNLTIVGRYLLITLLFVSICMGFLINMDTFYQRDALEVITRQIPVSCVFGQSAEAGSPEWDSVWNSVSRRVSLGDAIVMMSETTLALANEEEEQQVISKAMKIAGTTTSNYSVYIGITYTKPWSDSMVTNHFTLVSKDKLLWNYKKSHPVPLIEASVVAGPPVLPVVRDTPYGTIGGSICFDMDFPSYIRQAGDHSLNLKIFISIYCD